MNDHTASFSAREIDAKTNKPSNTQPRMCGWEPVGAISICLNRPSPQTNHRPNVFASAQILVAGTNNACPSVSIRV